MNVSRRFADLLRPDPNLTPGEEQDRASTELPSWVADSAMHWLAAPDSVNGTAEKLVVGVAVWSGYDLTLLDELNRFAAANPGVRVCVVQDIFSYRQCYVLLSLSVCLAFFPLPWSHPFIAHFFSPSLLYLPACIWRAMRERGN